ncbi:FecCD family ABC transporter permease [Desulfosporosinus youngiae]|uniref:ABC-type Fe3+-siderophore transport system, permease component n=1 Tax=Desulfosporosinus youngiae DSM 17734 TaxID=768710 RepID=H5XWL7_9FIRM|nr:iron ABC transporter permease [Desulfosporosinus youngiae]EHQ90525.1 ABC-type Fe3+-siderophore transport system, permease component [Desulfosporosinus youngiae DSM 17734]
MKQSLSRSEQKRLLNLKLFVLLGVLIVIFIGSFNFGRYSGISLREVTLIFMSKVFPISPTWPDSFETVVFYIRFPRIIAAVLIGGLLALAGASYQAVFKNPLVSPDILGASAGASFGAALAIFNGLGAVWIQISAFAMSLLAVGCSCLVGSRIKRDPALALILSGIFVSSLASALVSLLKFLADPLDKLPTITFWLLGTLANITITDIGWALIPMVIGAVPLILLRWRLNVLSMGEDEAKALGVETKQLRIVVIVCATILTAASISIGGLIGWVGLVIPHLARMIVGPNNKFLLPASLIIGGSFLLLVDNFARSLSSVEIPLGVLTAIVGAPFFISLMLRGKEAA